MMRLTGICALCTFALNLLFMSAAPAQEVPPPPADVQAIYKKLESRQPLSAAELKRVNEYSQELVRKYGGGAGAGAGSSQSKPQNAGGKPAASAAAGVEQLPCPARSGAPSAAAPAAPTRAEYVALVNSLVDTYGRRLGASKSQLDRVLAAPAAQSGSSGVAAALLMTGAAAASVYASAAAAQRHPEDLLAANNLGVALDSIPDSKTAARVFLYVQKQQPQAAMAVMNLGWAYFNQGASSLAQTQFEQAARLGPDLPGPAAGLGLLASCRGDQATALRQFRHSLSKGYSGLVAAGYRIAQQAQQPGDVYDAAEQFPPSSDPEFVPELPVTADPQATVASEQAFHRSTEFASQHAVAAGQKVVEAANRVAALARRAQLNPDGTLDLPRVFDKQLFEFGEVYRITMAATLKATYPEKYIETQHTLSAAMAASVQDDYAKAGPPLEESRKVWNEMEARCTGGPGYDACRAPYLARSQALEHEHDQYMYHACTTEKSYYQTDYAQYFKTWKSYSDLLRSSSRDFYAFSQPLIDEVWAPALNDLLQAERETVVMSLYQGDAETAADLAGKAHDIDNLKCVSPPPPKPPRTVKDPNLKKSEPDCPLHPPLKLGLIVVEMELGCDKVKISGGEVLRVKFERDFVKKETTYAVGVGASASMPKIDLGGGNGLGDNGSGWSPPGSAVSAGVGAEVMVSVRVNDTGAVQDVGLTSTVAATGKAAGFSGTVGVTGSVTMENGANVAPVTSFGASPSVSLPGGMSWKP